MLSAASSITLLATKNWAVKLPNANPEMSGKTNFSDSQGCQEWSSLAGKFALELTILENLGFTVIMPANCIY